VHGYKAHVHPSFVEENFKSQTNKSGVKACAHLLRKLQCAMFTLAHCPQQLVAALLNLVSAVLQLSTSVA
jgi:hypothetical protein